MKKKLIRSVALALSTIMLLSTTVFAAPNGTKPAGFQVKEAVDELTNAKPGDQDWDAIQVINGDNFEWCDPSADGAELAFTYYYDPGTDTWKSATLDQYEAQEKKYPNMSDIYYRLGDWTDGDHTISDLNSRYFNRGKDFFKIDTEDVKDLGNSKQSALDYKAYLEAYGKEYGVLGDFTTLDSASADDVKLFNDIKAEWSNGENTYWKYGEYEEVPLNTVNDVEAFMALEEQFRTVVTPADNWIKLGKESELTDDQNNQLSAAKALGAKLGYDLNGDGVTWKTTREDGETLYSTVLPVFRYEYTDTYGTWHEMGSYSYIVKDDIQVELHQCGPILYGKEGGTKIDAIVDGGAQFVDYKQLYGETSFEDFWDAKAIAANAITVDQSYLNSIAYNYANILQKDNGFHFSGSNTEVAYWYENKKDIPVYYYGGSGTIEANGIYGILIAPYAKVQVASSVWCGTIIAQSVQTKGQGHLWGYDGDKQTWEDYVWVNDLDPSVRDMSVVNYKTYGFDIRLLETREPAEGKVYVRTKPVTPPGEDPGDPNPPTPPTPPTPPELPKGWIPKTGDVATWVIGGAVVVALGFGVFLLVGKKKDEEENEEED